MTPSEPLVWYACYGSNLLSERFSHYICGGKPRGSTRVHPGCRDHTQPGMEKPLLLNHRLYFAQESKDWDNAGVAFIHGRAEPEAETLGKGYLLTREQFCDVFTQENKGSPPCPDIDFQSLIEGKSLTMGTGWYSRLLFLGLDEETGYPIFSFTSPVDDQEPKLPGKAYVETIIAGLLETYPGMTREMVLDYLEGWVFKP